jgi:hypothetical protein
MANLLKIKRSSVQGKVPTTGDLQLGELAINTYDGKLYTLKNTGTASVVEIGASAAISDGDRGEITVSNSGATWTVDNQAITYAKIQNVSATDRLLGRSTAGAGSVEEITCTAAGRALIDDADAAAQRTTLDLGSLATLSAVGNITSSGAIGSTANLPVITTTSGVLTTGSFGTTANTFCQGNDSRLSDTRNTTNSLTINNSGSGAASGTTFNGSAAVTISYNTVGAPSTTGANASGSWGISVTGSSASITGTTTAAVASSALGSGTADSTTFLRGDRTWATISGGGATITNETTTNATWYPTLSSDTSGSYSTAYVSNSKLTFNPSTGTLSSTNFTSLSDQSKKENVQQIRNATEIVQQLRGVEFTWKEGGQHSIGVIAQEIEKVLPEVVMIDDNGLRSVAYGNIVGVLIEAIKEQQLRLEGLEKKLNA